MGMSMDDIKNKKERNRARSEARERLTNWYMLQMAYGFVGVIVLHFIGNWYNMFHKPWIQIGGMSHLTYMDLAMFITATVFALGGGVLLYLWFKSGKEKSRFFNYAIFSWVITIVAVLISFYAQIRNVLMSMGLPLGGVHSNWKVWFFMSLIGIWLVVGFVYYLFRYRKI